MQEQGWVNERVKSIKGIIVWLPPPENLTVAHQFVFLCVFATPFVYFTDCLKLCDCHCLRNPFPQEVANSFGVRIAQCSVSFPFALKTPQTSCFRLALFCFILSAKGKGVMATLHANFVRFQGEFLFIVCHSGKNK